MKLNAESAEARRAAELRVLLFLHNAMNAVDESVHIAHPITFSKMSFFIPIFPLCGPPRLCELCV